MLTLFSAETADGNGTAYTAKTKVPVADVVFAANGGFGGGTVKLQVSADGTNYIDVTSAAMTAAGTLTVKIADGFKVRAVLTGATDATLNAYLIGAGALNTVTNS